MKINFQTQPFVASEPSRMAQICLAAYRQKRYIIKKGMVIYMDIGNKIKLLRQKIGVTQEQLGEKIGVSAQSISKWETGVSQT